MKNEIKFFVGLARDVAMLTFLILRISEVVLRLVSSAGIYRNMQWRNCLDMMGASSWVAVPANTSTFRPKNINNMVVG